VPDGGLPRQTPFLFQTHRGLATRAGLGKQDKACDRRSRGQKEGRDPEHPVRIGRPRLSFFDPVPQKSCREEERCCERTEQRVQRRKGRAIAQEEHRDRSRHKADKHADRRRLCEAQMVRTGAGTCVPLAKSRASQPQAGAQCEAGEDDRAHHPRGVPVRQPACQGILDRGIQSLDLLHRLRRQAGQERVQGAVEIGGIPRFKGHHHVMGPFSGAWVRTHQEIWKFGERLIQIVGNVAFALHQEDTLQLKRHPPESLAHGQKLPAQQLRDAGEDVDILDHDHREPQIPGIDQDCPNGQKRHFELALVGRMTLRPLNPLRHGLVELEGLTEGQGDSIQGEIVVGWTDSAGGEDEVVALAHLAHVLRDRFDHVWNHVDAFDVDTESAQFTAKKGRVRIDDFAREDLVADHEDSRAGHGKQGIEEAGIRSTGYNDSVDPLVRFLPSGRTLRVTPGTNLLEAACEVGLPIAQACSGEALCGRCAVLLLSGDRGVAPETALERQAKRRNRVAPELRLACQVVPTDGVEVTASYW